MADELPAKRAKSTAFDFDNSFDEGDISFEDELAALESEENSLRLETGAAAEHERSKTRWIGRLCVCQWVVFPRC